MPPVEGWTEGRWRSFIVSTLRGGMRRFPNKWIVLKEAYVGKQTGPSGRMVAHYRCAACNGDFTASMVQVDHRSPVVSPTDGFISWDHYIDKLFCTVENLQVLCINCHKQKTLAEKKERTCKTNSKTSTQTNPPLKKRVRRRSTSSSTTSPSTSKVASGVRASGKPSVKKRGK